MQLGTFSLKSFQFYVHVRYIKWNRFVFVATFRLEIIEKKSSIFALSVQKCYVKGTVDPKEANLTLMFFFSILVKLCVDYKYTEEKNFKAFD